MGQRAKVIHKFGKIMLCWNKALCLHVPSHMIIFSQSECIISEKYSYPQPKFVYDISSSIEISSISSSPLELAQLHLKSLIYFPSEVPNVNFCSDN